VLPQMLGLQNGLYLVLVFPYRSERFVRRRGCECVDQGPELMIAHVPTKVTK
jgi:hypothetical protein